MDKKKQWKISIKNQKKILTRKRRVFVIFSYQNGSWVDCENIILVGN